MVLAGIAFSSLAERNLIDNSTNLWGSWMFQGGFLLYILVDFLYRYFKGRASGKNRLTVNVNHSLRLAGILVCGVAAVVLVSTYFLELYVYSFPSNFPTIPFYLAILAFLLYLFGVGLYMEWRKRTNLNPSRDSL
jgi:CDP-diglyceride synthetase